MWSPSFSKQLSLLDRSDSGLSIEQVAYTSIAFLKNIKGDTSYWKMEACGYRDA